jgi:sugar lactone lactonase YvrE
MEDCRTVGDSRLIAAVPSPGYPEAVAVHHGRIYVSSPAAFGVDRSRVFVYDLVSGALLDTILIAGEPFLGGASCLAFGDRHHLYLLVESLGVVKVDVRDGSQSLYSGPFPVVFHSAYNPPAPELLNDLAFSPDGDLYITDSFQATLWRVPRGGGQPQVWFSGPAIDAPFGPNGCRVGPDGDRVYFTITFDPARKGYVYSLPVIDSPSASDLRVEHVYEAGAGPDGIAFDSSGRVCVCLAGSSQISVIDPRDPDPDSNEVARFSGPAQNPADPSQPLAWTNPANVAFDNDRRRVIVTNHASLVRPVNPALFAVFDLFLDETGARLFTEH